MKFQRVSFNVATKTSSMRALLITSCIIALFAEGCSNSCAPSSVGANQDGMVYINTSSDVLGYVAAQDSFVPEGSPPSPNWTTHSIAVTSNGNAYYAGTAGGASTLIIVKPDGETSQLNDANLTSRRRMFYEPLLAADRHGSLYVAEQVGRISRFSDRQQGRVRPIGTWSYDWENYNSMTVADDGTMFFASADRNSIAILRLGIKATARIVGKLHGPNTTLDRPVALAVDRSGRLFVVNQRSNSIAIFAPHAMGDIAPIGLIRGLSTRLEDPAGIALGKHGILFITSGTTSMATRFTYPDGELLIFPSTARDNVAPMNVVRFRRGCATESL